MKQLFAIIALLLMTTAAAGQTKVVERSAKKVPEWLNTATPNFLVVTVDASTIAEAQSKAMAEVRERIILSVASNVSVTQINTSSEITTNDNVESVDEYKRVAKMKSANIPFLNGISMAKVTELYWEKLQVKSTKEQYYQYSIKYPFSSIEQRRLKAEFERIDDEKVATFKALEEGIDKLESVDDIPAALGKLNALKEYFFDDVRQKEVEGLIKRYQALYNALSVTGQFTENGDFRCVVLLNGRPVRTSTAPKVKSNCASQIGVEASNGAFLISYDATDCLPDEENYLDIAFIIEGKRLTYKAYLNQAATESFSVVAEGKIYLLAAEVDANARKLTDISLRMTLNNKGETAFGIKSIELEIPDLTTPLIFDNLDAVYSSKGIIQLKVLAEGQFNVRQQKSVSSGLVKGAITVANPNTGRIERIRIALPYATNWE